MEMIDSYKKNASDAAYSQSNETKSPERRGPDGRPVRELNPSLFGEGSSKTKLLEGPINNQFPHLIQSDQKIQDLKSQISIMAETMGKWNQQYAEFMKTCQLKFDRVGQILTKLESNDQAIISEATQKFSRINDRLAERKSVEAKIQEMIDRHNSVVRSFELRLNQMQKLLADKETQMMSTQAALNEAKVEIARLKRL